MAVDLVSCTACGAQIWWGTTVGGRRMPIDPTPDPDGTVLPVLDGGKKRVRVMTGPEMPWQGPGVTYPDHRATCPKATTARLRTGPRCAACHNLMDTWLVEQQRRYHVNCAPSTAPERRLAERLAAQDAAALDQIEHRALAAEHWADPHPMTCTCTECYVPDREAG